MKQLRPILILLLGPAVLAAAVLLVTWWLLPGQKTTGRFVQIGVTAAAAGVLIFAPVAGVALLATKCPNWMARHRMRMDWYASCIMALSLGYIVACVRHAVYDRLTAGCMLLVVIGAAVKLTLSNPVPPNVEQNGR